MSSTAFFTSCVQGHRGRTCQNATRRTKPVIAVSSSGFRSGVIRGVLEALAEHLRVGGILDLEEAFIDGSFAPAKRGALGSARQSVAKAPRSWQLQTAMVFRSPSARKVLPHMR